MAEIGYTVEHIPRTGTIYQWANVTESDTFQPVRLSSPDAPVTVQVYGTFGGATVSIEASMKGSDYNVVKDTTGTALSLTAAFYESVLPYHMLYVKPTHSGGTSESITVEVCEGAVR